MRYTRTIGLAATCLFFGTAAHAQSFGFCDTPSPAEFNAAVPPAQTTTISNFARTRFTSLSRAPRVANSSARQADARLARTQTTITYDGLIDAANDALTDFNATTAAQNGSPLSAGGQLPNCRSPELGCGRVNCSAYYSLPLCE